MTVFNFVFSKVWKSLISFMLRFKLSGLKSSCVGRKAIKNLCVTLTLFMWCNWCRRTLITKQISWNSSIRTILLRIRQLLFTVSFKKEIHVQMFSLIWELIVQTALLWSMNLLLIYHLLS